MPFSKNYEELAEEVRKYPCLYDKRQKDYKDGAIKSRAWLEIATKLEYEDEKTAETSWDNLKKLLFLCLFSRFIRTASAKCAN